jgi:hypothetical protein
MAASPPAITASPTSITALSSAITPLPRDHRFGFVVRPIALGDHRFGFGDRRYALGDHRIAPSDRPIAPDDRPIALGDHRFPGLYDSLERLVAARYASANWERLGPLNTRFGLL